MGWFKSKESDKDRRQRIVQDQIAAATAYIPAPSVRKTDYVAPEPSSPREPVLSRSPVQSTQEPPTEDIGEMVMVGSNHRGAIEENDDIGDVENTTSSFSRGTESDPGRVPMRYQQTIAGGKHTHLNSLFNGHLMKWKFAAEEGTSFIRVPVCKFLDDCELLPPFISRRESTVSNTIHTYFSFGSTRPVGDFNYCSGAVPRGMGTPLHSYDGWCGDHVTFHHDP